MKPNEDFNGYRPSYEYSGSPQMPGPSSASSNLYSSITYRHGNLPRPQQNGPAGPSQSSSTHVAASVISYAPSASNDPELARNARTTDAMKLRRRKVQSSQRSFPVEDIRTLRPPVHPTPVVAVNGTSSAMITQRAEQLPPGMSQQQLCEWNNLQRPSLSQALFGPPSLAAIEPAIPSANSPLTSLPYHLLSAKADHATAVIHHPQKIRIQEEAVDVAAPSPGLSALTISSQETVRRDIEEMRNEKDEEMKGADNLRTEKQMKTKILTPDNEDIELIEIVNIPLSDAVDEQPSSADGISLSDAGKVGISIESFDPAVPATDANVIAALTTIFEKSKHTPNKDVVEVVNGLGNSPYAVKDKEGRQHYILPKSWKLELDPEKEKTKMETKLQRKLRREEFARAGITLPKGRPKLGETEMLREALKKGIDSDDGVIPSSSSAFTATLRPISPSKPPRKKRKRASVQKMIEEGMAWKAPESADKDAAVKGVVCDDEEEEKISFA